MKPYNIAGYDFARQTLQYISCDKIKAYYKGHFVFIACDKSISFFTYKILIKSPEGKVLMKETIKCSIVNDAINYAFEKLKL